MPISLFHTKAARPSVYDVSEIINRPASGVSNGVRHSFTAINSSDSSVGIIGWCFKQNGILYSCSIMDDLGNEKYDIRAEVAAGEEYLHRQPQMGLAEKAHVVSIVQQLMNQNSKQFILKLLARLEDSCSDSRTGAVSVGPKAPVRLLRDGEVHARVGLCFPDAANYKRRPEPVILALEWVVGPRRILIDCSDVFPQYLISERGRPYEHMSGAEADAAIKFAKADAAASNIELFRLAVLTNLWLRLEAFAKFLPPQRSPSP